MKRAVLILSLCLIPFLFQACVPVTYTAYHANRYRLGRTLGGGGVHMTTSLATAPLIQSAGEDNAIISTVHSGATVNGELTLGVLDRTDIILGGGFGTGSGYGTFAVQQQLTPRGQPFALSVAPGMTFIDGRRDNQEPVDIGFGSNNFSSWIDSRMTVAELRVPMSYRCSRYVELLWETGLLYFDHHAEYGNSDGVTRGLDRHWLTGIGSVGIRLGFFTLEATYLSCDGHPVATLGTAFRFGL